MEDFFPAKQIVPRVWVGSREDAHSPQFLQRHNIRHIINCTRNISFKFPRLSGYRIPVDDHPDENPTMLRHLPVAVAAIESALAFGDEAVLVHCYAGISRSSTVVCALLMKRHGWTPRRAMQAMQGVKPEVFRPQPNFEPALQEFYRQYVA